MALNSIDDRTHLPCVEGDTLPVMDSSLLFVNKTQTSRHLSKSKAGERSAMLSFVQNNRRRHEAEASQRPKPWSRFITTLATSEISEPLRTGGVELKFVDFVQRKKKPVNTSAAKERSSKETNHSKSLSRALKPSYNASDPFHCTVAKLDAGTHAILHITFSHASRTNFLAESFAPSSKLLPQAPMRHHHMFQLRLRRCVEDEKLMYSTLAYGSSLLGWMMGRFDAAKQPEYFLDKALRSVRAYLCTPGYRVDDWLLLSMYALAVTEMWNSMPMMWKQTPQRYAMVTKLGSRGYDTCRMHLRALLQAANDAGGWEQFDPYVLDSVILADKYLASTEGKPPVIPITWDPGPLPLSIRQELGITGQSTLHRLGTGFLREPLSEELDRVLRELVSYCRIASEAWSSSLVVGHEAECWLFRRSQAITYRLLLHIHDESTRRVERCICFASLAFIGSCEPARGPQVSARHAVGQLVVCLDEDDDAEQETDVCEEIYHWLLFIGSMVSEPGPQRLWFLERLAQHCHGEIVPSDLEERLEPYLYLPSRQGTRLRLVVEQLNAFVGG